MDQVFKYCVQEGGGEMEKPRQKNCIISLLLLYQGRIRGRNRQTPRVYLKGTLHQELCVKTENLFLEKRPFSGKCPQF